MPDKNPIISENIQKIVKTYIEEWSTKAQAEINCFRKQNTLEDAVRLAGLAQNCQGKRFHHQRRLKQCDLKKAQEALLANLTAIKEAADFDKLLDLLDNLVRPINGIGELYIYDTALRIAAKKGTPPSKIYLHAGVEKGARILGFDARAEAIETSALVAKYPDFAPLEPHEIEDVLCIFTNELGMAMSAETIRENIARRSRCR